MPRYAVPSNRFLEVDKTWRGDVNLCWAASSCATLWITGWANNQMYWDNPDHPNVRSRFTGPNDLLRYTKQHFADYGGWGYWHMLWFLTGSYAIGSSNMIALNGGGFYSLTPQEAMRYIYNVNTEHVFNLLWSWFNKINGLGGLTAAFYFGKSTIEPESYSRHIAGAHEVPLWGFGYDEESESVFGYPDRQPVSELDPTRLTSIQISDPDDSISNNRFWLRTYYCPGSHLYKCVPDPLDPNVPSNWRGHASIWLNALTLLAEKPQGLIHTRCLE